MKLKVTPALRDKFCLFYNGPFCQWDYSPFYIGEHFYNCAEQYMMAEKARVFGDEEALKAIMASNDPAFQKATGRTVRGFDRDRWEKDAKLIVYRGSLAKYTQNDQHRAVLLGTLGKTIVEASPTDKIWGIGRDEDDPRCYFPEHWDGANWLGEILMKVRDDLSELSLYI